MGVACIFNVAGPERGEVDALLHGIKLAIRRNWDHMIFEGDSASVINRVSKHGEDVMLLGFKIKECVSLLESGANFTVRWCHRNGNAVANRLSKYALYNVCSLCFN